MLQGYSAGLEMRLLTRSDFDGLVCAAILKELRIVNEICYVHPKDVQDNKIKATKNDVIANLPYVEGCGMWFDHHSSEIERLKLKGKFVGAIEPFDSAARVVFNYFRARKPYSEIVQKFEELVKIADIVDSAKFTKTDIMNPQGWTMLAFISDPRSNFGKKHTFRVSNLGLLKTLPDLLCSSTVDEILAMPDFKERINAYKEDIKAYKKILLEYTKVAGDAIVIDFREMEYIPIGNRFLEYVLHPEQNISIRAVNGKDKQFVTISLGHSIINRTSDVDVGHLTLRYGGGGHRRAGACQVNYEDADKIIQEILQVINNGQPKSTNLSRADFLKHP
jgi:oligoribonuclease NrnB/cAMP/cGMP phosphodiesterase (DHH superfamily)